MRASDGSWVVLASVRVTGRVRLSCLRIALWGGSGGIDGLAGCVECVELRNVDGGQKELGEGRNGMNVVEVVRLAGGGKSGLVV